MMFECSFTNVCVRWFSKSVSERLMYEYTAPKPLMMSRFKMEETSCHLFLWNFGLDCIQRWKQCVMI
jgi:hypothetical protein